MVNIQCENEKAAGQTTIFCFSNSASESCRYGINLGEKEQQSTHKKEENKHQARKKERKSYKCATVC